MIESNSSQNYVAGGLLDSYRRHKGCQDSFFDFVKVLI